MALASIYSSNCNYNHYHLQFDVAAGKTKFRAAVNLLLQRNGIALRMTNEGLMKRILDDPAGESIRRAVFQTGDTRLNQFLEEARAKLIDPSPRVRQEALERAWDAWERVKTMKDKDKKRGAKILLDACATERMMRKVLEEEAKALTWLGNNLRIRHSETSKPEVADAEHVDYLFRRMFSMLLLILRKNSMLA